MDTERISARKRILFIALIVVGVPVVGFLLVEGGASLFLLGRDIVRAAAQRHAPPITQYDTLLGWANRPGLTRPDHFGPGKHLRINALGFRGGELSLLKPAGRLRVVCSGDSFTFGSGVGDADTWCAQLSAQHPAIEPVNMGQQGYGVDQAYLWFRRDGIPLKPDLHLFTFIWDDFTRMQVTRTYGFGKPVLELEGDELKVGNVPVPPTGFKFPRLARFGREAWAALHGLRAYDLAQSFRERMAGPAGIQAPRDSATWEIASRMIADLADTHARNGSVFVVVHLAERLHVPGSDDRAPNADEWRRRLQSGAERQGYRYLDLTPYLERLSPDSQVALFIPDDPHYSEVGNRWAAAHLYEYLTSLPELQARLGGSRSGERPMKGTAKPPPERGGHQALDSLAPGRGR
jgi:hypothetical protein